MFTCITSHAGALITATVMLTSAAILRGGTTAADPNQDDQFLALLEQQDIPALQGVPNLIYTAHRVCLKLDAGMPVDVLVDTMVNNAYRSNPTYRLYDPGRVARTEVRFITAAVEAYCPYDQGKIASVMANPAGWNEQTHRVAAYMVNSANDLREPPSALDMINMPAPWQESTGTGASRLSHLTDGGVVVAGRSGDHRSVYDAHGTVLAWLMEAIPSGDITQPDPPQIPPPPPPTVQIQAPHQPVAAPPRPKQPPPLPQKPPPPPQQPPPPPQQPPPPPQEVEPPAVGPQPGGAAGSGGGDSTGGNRGGGNGRGSTGRNGGGGPAEPSPAPSMPPGLVRLAP